MGARGASRGRRAGGGQGRLGGLSSGLPRPGVDTPGPNLPSFLPGAPESGERTGRTSTSPEAAASDTRGPQPGEAPGRRPGRRRTRATRVTGGQEGAYGPALGGAELRRTPNKGGPPGSRGGLRAGTMELAGICPGRVVWTGTKVEVGRQPELSGGQPDGRGSGRGGVRRAWNLLEHLCLLACWQDLRGARISGRGPGGPRTRQLPPGTRAGGRAGGAGPGTARGPLGVLPARAGRLLLARHSPGGPGACTLPSSAAAPLKD